MDYEKKYNEALEQAKGYMDAGSSDLTDVLPEIFPELRESEDEKIRKDIIGGLMWQRDNLKSEGPHDNNLILPGFCFTVGKHLTYLEKQKEQPISAEEVLARAGLKPYKDGNQWCILAGDNIQEGICGFGDTIEDALYEFLKEVLDLQKEQKPVETSDFKTKLAEYLQNNSPKDGQYVISSESILEMAKEELIKRGELQKPVEWSEEDKAMIERLIRHVQQEFDELCNDRYGHQEIISDLKESCRERMNWLENRLKSLRPIVNANSEKVNVNWSEEDERIKSCIGLALTDVDEQRFKDFGTTLKDCLAWLKSLRPQWKPTEEQMTMLRAVLNDPNNAGAESCQLALSGLYEQLKKL